MNNVNLSGIIRNSSEAILGQNLVGFAKLDMGTSTISILSMGGKLPEDGTEVRICGQSTNHIFVASSRVNSDDSLSSYEVRFTDKPLQAWTLVFDCQKVANEQVHDYSEESDTNFDEFTPLPKNAPLIGSITDLGEDFIELNGEKYTYTEKAKAALSITLVLYKQVRIFWNFAVDGSGEKLCFGVYEAKKEGKQEKKSHKSNDSSKYFELKDALVTGGTDNGIFINSMFFTRTRMTQGSIPKRGERVDVKVTSLDPAQGIKRYLLSVYPTKQQQLA